MSEQQRSSQSSVHSTDYDIIISGYGPAGATIANLMGKRGYSVAVIDQFEAIFDKPRAITADQEVMRVFQEIGLADEINASSTPHPGTDFVGMDGQVIKRFYPAPPPNQLAWEPTWMFVQPELEATLRKGVARFDNVTELLGHQLVRHEKRGDGVKVELLRLSDQQTVNLTGRYLLSCEGANSPIRLRENASVEDLAFDEWWIVVDMWIRGPIELPERCVQYCRPSRPGTYIVGPDNLRRWEMKMLPGEDPQEFMKDPALVMKALSSFVDTTHLELCRIAVYRFHAVVVDDWRFDRVFLLGDSAHQMPPFLGQGLCAAVRDAVNLAWKIDGVERQGYSQRILDTYGHERKKHVRTVVGHAKSFGLIIGELDEAKARKRDEELGELLASGKSETVRQKFIPGLETGALARNADGSLLTGAGDLFVQPWVRQGDDWTRMDEVMPCGFWIATTPDMPTHEWSQSPAWRQMNGRTVVVHDNEFTAPKNGDPQVLHVEEQGALFTDWLKQYNGVAVLVRPDHYVYGVAHSVQELKTLIDGAAKDLFDQPKPESDLSHGVMDARAALAQVSA